MSLCQLYDFTLVVASIFVLADDLLTHAEVSHGCFITLQRRKREITHHSSNKYEGYSQKGCTKNINHNYCALLHFTRMNALPHESNQENVDECLLADLVHKQLHYTFIWAEQLKRDGKLSSYQHFCRECVRRVSRLERLSKPLSRKWISLKEKLWMRDLKTADILTSIQDNAN